MFLVCLFWLMKLHHVTVLSSLGPGLNDQDCWFSSPGLKDPCQIENGGCEQRCSVDEYGSVICQCSEGLELASNNHSCFCKCVFSSFLLDGQPVNQTCQRMNVLPYIRLVDHPGKISDGIVVAAVSASCSPEQFNCANGSCVDYEKTCDHMHDCHDQSDENQSYCSEHDLNFRKSTTVVTHTHTHTHTCS